MLYKTCVVNTENIQGIHNLWKVRESIFSLLQYV